MSVGARAQLQECLLARRENVGPLRHSVCQFASSRGATARQLEDIAVAVSEALSNVVRHAYATREDPGPMTVQASARGGTLVVVVHDEGTGMRPGDSRGAGMGLRLIFELTERLEF